MRCSGDVLFPIKMCVSKTLFDVSSRLIVTRGRITVVFRSASLSRMGFSHMDRRAQVVLLSLQAQYSLLSLGAALVVLLYFRFAEEVNSMVQAGILELVRGVTSKLEAAYTLQM
jgi:hypothetical protein